MPGVIPGVMPGERFSLLLLQWFVRERGKVNLTPRYRTNATEAQEKDLGK